jgi:chromosome segregation ATPase
MIRKKDTIFEISEIDQTIKDEKAKLKPKEKMFQELEERYNVINDKIKDFKSALTELRNKLASEDSKKKAIETHQATGQKEYKIKGKAKLERIQFPEEINRISGEMEILNKQILETESKLKVANAELKPIKSEFEKIRVEKEKSSNEVKFWEELRNLTLPYDELSKDFGALLETHPSEEHKKIYNDLQIILIKAKKLKSFNEAEKGRIELIYKMKPPNIATAEGKKDDIKIKSELQELEKKIDISNGLVSQLEPEIVNAERIVNEISSGGGDKDALKVILDKFDKLREGANKKYKIFGQVPF